jgi:ATP synthase protein I
MLDRRPHSSRPTISFAEQISTKAARKIKARRYPTAGVWFGLGMMGLIGWSVVVPTLVGAAVGMWLDKHHPGMHAWTLALLVAGLIIGCANALHWVVQEQRSMHDEPEDDHDHD